MPWILRKGRVTLIRNTLCMLVYMYTLYTIQRRDDLKCISNKIQSGMKSKNLKDILNEKKSSGS